MVRADSNLPDVPIITAPELKSMLDENTPLLLIHALSPIEFSQQHIPGSINIPAPLVPVSELLRKDDPRPKVFYCMGVKCAYSRRAVEYALARGLPNVMWFRGGIPEWRQFDYPLYISPVYNKLRAPKFPCARVKALLETRQPFVLDVRPPWLAPPQWFLPDTVHVPMTELQAYLPHLPKDRAILITDVTMRQSVSAYKFLKKAGYSVLGVVRGGLQKGREMGCPVVEQPVWRAEEQVWRAM